MPIGTMVLSDHIAAATGMAPYGDGLVSFAVANLALYQGVLSPFLEGLE